MMAKPGEAKTRGGDREVVVVDLFAGAGGTSRGLALACEKAGIGLGRMRLTAVNHWSTAIESHKRNHPWADHLCASVQSLDPRVVVQGGILDLMVASPECFPAGTLILTKAGLKPIETVTTADELPPDLRRREFERLGLAVVEPWLVKDDPRPEDWKPFLARSRYGAAAPEGVMLKNYTRPGRDGGPLFAKVVNPEFSERRAREPQAEEEKSAEAQVAETFVTKGRVEKAMFRLLDEGRWSGGWEMHALKYVRAEVVRDILEEEGDEVAEEHPKLDEKALLKEVGVRTKAFLAEVIEERHRRKEARKR